MFPTFKMAFSIQAEDPPETLNFVVNGNKKAVYKLESVEDVDE